VGKSGFVKPLETLPPMVSNGETKSSEKSSVVGKKKALAVLLGKNTVKAFLFGHCRTVTIAV